ncbi:CHASE2 domain-containing protein [Castellaniella sp.]|uniref:CHASE2 domain-containing protein n=1 Tax=Castellaniella sp. TaxID=1955812 RepID=UPI002AFFBC54|nr:CHASE2 domain-containing protein [Castellaniella sp.]
MLSLLTLCLISLLMLWLGDKLNGQGMAVTRYLARMQAPLAAQAYPDDWGKQISVITYDNEFLRHNDYAWPIPYQDHADWLDRLTADPTGRPKALFLDITFGQARDDDGIQDLAQVLCDIQNTRGIPVFLAALADPATGWLSTHPALMQAQQAAQPCLTLVGVTHHPDPIDGVTWSYPLTVHAEQGQIVNGRPASPETPHFQSAALTLAEQVGRIPLGEETHALALVWGKSHMPSRPSAYWQHCSPAKHWPWLAIPNFIRDILGDTPVLLSCPTHDTLSMKQVGELEDEALRTYTKDKYVFVGAMIDGYNDFAQSPVQGRIPGVFVHAMALDNLLTYGKRYKQDAGWAFPPSWGLALICCITVFSVLLARTCLRSAGKRLAERYRTAPGLDRLAARGTAHPWLASTLRLTGRAAGWALRVWVQLIIATAMIILLQHYFRIGSLPVIELIGMTLLAEGFNYLDKLRRYLGTRISQQPAGGRSTPATSTIQKETS